jgi:hypothetical protein
MRWLALVLLGGCLTFGAPSRVKEGQLYKAGEARYDAYFREVHELQTITIKWPDDRALARRPLLEALKLEGDASESTMAQLTFEQCQKSDARLEINGDDAKVVGAKDELASALEATAKNELERAKKLKALVPKAESLARTGKEMEPHVATDFAKSGGSKPTEVRRELAASYEAMGEIATRAKKEALAAEHFVQNLQRAVSSKPNAAPPPPPASTSAPPPVAKPPPAPRPPATWTPPPPVAVKPAEPPKPADPPKPPPQKPPDQGEVFNP